MSLGINIETDKPVVHSKFRCAHRWSTTERGQGNTADHKIMRVQDVIATTSQPPKTYLVWIVLRFRNPDNDGFIICAPPQPTVPKTNPPAAPIHAATSLDDDIVIFSSWTWESRNNCNNYCAITDCVREQWESWRALFKYYGRCNSFSSWSRLLSFDNRRSLGVDHWLKKIYLALMMNFYVYLRVRIASLVNHRSLIGCIDHWRLTIGCNLVTPR